MCSEFMAEVTECRVSVINMLLTAFDLWGMY